MKNISKTIKTAAPVVAGLLAFTAVTQAGADTPGLMCGLSASPPHYATTRLLAVFIAVVALVFSSIGIWSSKRRVAVASAVALLIPGAVFMEPEPVREFITAVGEMLGLLS